MKDYSKGRYAVLGHGPGAALKGWIDNDEYVRAVSGEILYQIEGEAVYSAGRTERLGHISQGVAFTDSGMFLFRLEED
ncbi:hypothetical protein [Pseudomonas sp. LFM046]|uniref:hypothetical protein n=1 Tax=Pseudomonas sp. LFM046 TaxID=1608357 RepID=UPI0011AF8244|nr:hypothetical protein [Pseudomonas sp. LFM046]